MAVTIINHGGGRGMAIRVIGGTVQPTGAAGMLWVNTNVQANKWTFSAASPSGPAAGDLWMQTDAANAHTINLFRRNPAIVNVVRVKQYNGTTWELRLAYYHDGAGWAQISSTFNPATDITYSGNYTLVDEGNDNWHIDFLTSGTLTFLQAPGDLLDVFVRAGGGGGGSGYPSGGGGGGYTRTEFSVSVSEGSSTVSIGAGGAKGSGNGTGGTGGTTTLLGYSVTGGLGGGGYSTGKAGGNGGSGGGGAYSAGGSNGANGAGTGGTGQGTTTREFALASGTLASGGGGGSGALGADGAGNGASSGPGGSAAANSGGGGGGAGAGDQQLGGLGGSGKAAIRNHRAA